MAATSLLKAFNMALFEEMEADPSVVCIGEDIGPKGGCWGTFTGLEAKFGKNRVVQTPLAEQNYSTMATGMALMGHKVVCEFMFGDFATLGFEAIANIAAKMRFNCGGKVSVPVTFILPQGGGGKSGSQHSQTVEAWFANIPGLKLVAPTMPADVRAYLRAAIRDPDPVLFFYPRAGLGYTAEVPEKCEVPSSILNAANIMKEGKDLTVITWHRPLWRTLDVIPEIEKKTGKTIELIDPRVLNPLDTDKIFSSVKKTGKVLLVGEAPERGSYSQLISALISENCMKDLKAPVARLGAKNTVIAFGRVEEYAYPQQPAIAEAIEKLLNA